MPIKERTLILLHTGSALKSMNNLLLSMPWLHSFLPGTNPLVYALKNGLRPHCPRRYGKQRQYSSIMLADFCDVAQKSKDYGHYASRMQQMPEDRLDYLGIAVCGPDKAVNSLTGNLGLLR